MRYTTAGRETSVMANNYEKTIVEQVVTELKSKMEAYPIIYIETEDRELIYELLKRDDCFSIFKRPKGKGPDGKYQYTKCSYQREMQEDKEWAINVIIPSSNYSIKISDSEDWEGKPIYYLLTDYEEKDKRVINAFIQTYFDKGFNKPPLNRSLIIVSPLGMKVGNDAGCNIPSGFDQYIHLISVPMMGIVDIAALIVAAQNEGLAYAGLSAPLTVEAYLKAPDHYIESLKGMSRTQVKSILYLLRNQFGVVSRRGIPGDMESQIDFDKLERQARIFSSEYKQQYARKNGDIEFKEYARKDGDPDAKEKEDLVEPKNIDGIEAWLDDQKMVLDHPLLASECGQKFPKGVLIAGLPGSGKSLLAKYVSKKLELPLIQFKMAMVLQGIVGQSEQRMTQVLKLFEASAPCVIWIDEIEKEFSGMNNKEDSDSGVSRHCLAMLLNWMQEHKSQCFICATANRTDTLPQELLRRGRFDRLYYSFLPMEEQCVQILQSHIMKIQRDYNLFDNSVNPKSVTGMGHELFEQIAKNKRQFFTGSDLEGWFNDARFLLFKEAVQASKRSPVSIDALRIKLYDALNNVMTYAETNFDELIEYWLGMKDHPFRNIACPDVKKGDSKYNYMLFDFPDLQFNGREWNWKPDLVCRSKRQYDINMFNELKNAILLRKRDASNPPAERKP